jgi:hypothetical protein
MTTEKDYQNLYDQIAALRETVANRLAADLIEKPQLADVLTQQIDQMLAAVMDQELQEKPPPDKGLAQLIGIGSQAVTELGATRVPVAVEPYDETVTSERVKAVGDMYYIYSLEKVGVFRAILKLQELYKAGTVRLSSGEGAFGLYQYDRRQVMRHTQRDRMQSYRRVFGYTSATPPAGAKPNRDFHHLFVQFMTEVARFYRDKRISEVIRTRANDPSFGSIAVTRRAGLDLRNNLKGASYGEINVLRVELLQLLDEAFRILNTPDVKKLFGADNAWDVIEEVMRRYLGKPQINASPRSRMAIAGRDVIRWLAQPHILNASRAEFEALLTEIADEAEEWLTSAEALRIVKPRSNLTVSRNGSRTGARYSELEWELGAE